MKRNISLDIMMFGLVAFLGAFTIQNKSFSPEINFVSAELIDDSFPEDVQKVFKEHCNDCHTSASKNLKSKGKLNFDKWDGLSMMKKTGKLNDITKTVSEKKMPPEKYVSKNPDKKLNDEQIKLVTDWAQKTMDSFKD